MEEGRKKSHILAPVVEAEIPKTAEESQSDGGSNSGSVLEKDGASSSTSEELLYLDDSTSAPKRDSLKASSPFGRSAKLPPRAPVCPGDPDVEGVQPSQPSMVTRMQDTNKHYVDPQDARTLLPGVLFNSSSLDLDGAIDEQRAQEKLQEEVLLGLLRQKELENLYLQQQQRQQQDLLLAASASGLSLDVLQKVFMEQCRVSPPPGFPQQQYNQDQSNPYIMQQMMNRPRHGRSVSDPTFAFAGAINSMPPPFQSPQMETTVTTPLVDQTDALAFLNLSNVPQQQRDWTLPELRPSIQPNMGNYVPMSNPMPEIPKMESMQPKRRAKHGPSKSVDFNVLMKPNKGKGGNTSKDRNLPMSPPSNKSTTRAEVKKMVEYQARLGRPTYAPWFRDRSKNNKDVEGSNETPPAHHRSQSLPQVNTAIPVRRPQRNSEEEETPKSSRAGTGVFLPRMPVSN